jgi:hypothetical protein
MRSRQGVKGCDPCQRRLELIARYSGRLVSNPPCWNKRNPGNYAITDFKKATLKKNKNEIKIKTATKDPEIFFDKY